MSAKPYLPSPEGPDDDEYERFMSLSESEADAELEQANREFSEFCGKMTLLQEYRYWRRYILTTIMQNRRRLRNPALARIEVIDEMWRQGIRKSQQCLLKHRHHLRTGIWPGGTQ